MPSVRSPAKVEELSWDSFPSPAAGAATWKPDPDSIPVAGSLPDPRFNKDPFAEQLKQAQKRDKLLFGPVIDRSSEGPTTSSPDTTRATTPLSAGRWPTPIPRAKAPSSFASQSISDEPTVTAGALVVAPNSLLNKTFKPGTTSELTNKTRGTMEMLIVQPPFNRPPSPPMSVSSLVDGSQNDTDVPDWARPLEHLLQASYSKPFLPDRAAPVQQQHTALSLVSTSPHLRQHKKEVRTTSTTASSGFIFARPHITSQAGPHGQDHVFENNVISAQPVKDIKLQKTLLESFMSAKPVSTSRMYQRYLQTRLISIMEDEMDVQGRTTRRELHAMDDKTFESHFGRTMSMHKNTWDHKQTIDDVGKKT